ncbi:MAG: DUF2089 domain-containing protein [Chloroflexi bacterium]|nr:DUF2089 domain-containing protein [Chloroflexota bacterium]
MHPIPSECPVCHSELTVTKLYCRECDTTIEGRFISGPFSQLTLAQIEFVEIFIKNEGKITHMETELGLSYPTIRNRLHEVIRALGYEPGKADSRGLTDKDRRKILDELNQGIISSEDAMQMLTE